MKQLLVKNKTENSKWNQFNKGQCKRCKNIRGVLKLLHPQTAVFSPGLKNAFGRRCQLVDFHFLECYLFTRSFISDKLVPQWWLDYSIESSWVLVAPNHFITHIKFVLSSTSNPIYRYADHSTLHTCKNHLLSSN